MQGFGGKLMSEIKITENDYGIWRRIFVIPRKTTKLNRKQRRELKRRK